jgi:hypothetical protein
MELEMLFFTPQSLSLQVKNECTARTLTENLAAWVLHPVSTLFHQGWRWQS